MDQEIAKRLALAMAVLCVRNTCIEDIRAALSRTRKPATFPMQRS